MPQMTANQRWIVLSIVYLLFLLIGLGALAAAMGWLPNANQKFIDWAIAVLFGDIAAAALVGFKTLFGPTHNQVFVTIQFPVQPGTKVDPIKAEFEVRNGKAIVKSRGEAALALQAGGWMCSFPNEPEDFDYATLQFTERDGTKWRVASFSLYSHAVLAEKV